MTSPIDGVKQTIKDLLNLAGNDAAFDGEIENALSHAKRLMTAYHLSEDDLQDKEKEPTYEAKKSYSKGVKVTSWELDLAGFVCDLIGSTGTYWRQRPETQTRDIPGGGPIIINGGKKATPIFFYGIAEDVELAYDLYKRLSLVVYTLAKLRYGSVLRGDGRNYAEGFVEGLHTKLRKVELADISSSPETKALIVKSTSIANRKKQDAMAALNLRLRNSTRSFSGVSNADAKAQGRADGAKMSVSAGRKDKISGSKQRRIE